MSFIFTSSKNALTQDSIQRIARQKELEAVMHTCQDWRGYEINDIWQSETPLFRWSLLYEGYSVQLRIYRQDTIMKQLMSTPVYQASVFQVLRSEMPWWSGGPQLTDLVCTHSHCLSTNVYNEHTASVSTY